MRLSVVSVNGTEFIGPWATIGPLLRFSDTHSCDLRRDFGRFFHQQGSLACVSAAGLAAICRAHGHAQHLLTLAAESADYRCPLRAFDRLLQNPHAKPDSAVLDTVRVVKAADRVWLTEASVLALFGAETRAKPAALSQSVVNNSSSPQLVRALYDLKKGELVLGAKNLSAARAFVLCPEAASTVFRSLVSCAIPASCPMSGVLDAAAARFIAQAKLAQQQKQQEEQQQQQQQEQQQHQKQHEPARDQAVEVAGAVFELAATVLCALSAEQCLSPALTDSLAALSAQLGSALRLRNAGVASLAVRQSKTELQLSAIARYTNEAYLQRCGEPVTLALLRSLLGCGQVRSERGDARNRRNVFTRLENTAKLDSAEAMRTAALITSIDCILRSTNTAFVSARSYAVASDMLTVSGMRFVALCTRSCRCFSMACVIVFAGSARVVNVLARLGVAAPTASALRKETKRFQKALASQQQQQSAAFGQLSVVDFRDNIEKFRRKSCRSRANKRVAPYKSRVVRFPLYTSPSHPHSRTQFTAPLRASPLPALTMADFVPSPAGQAAYDAFRQQCMLDALVTVLSSPADPVGRQLTIHETLHADGVGAKVCVSALCRDRFGRLYATTKRKCRVSHCCCLFCFCLCLCSVFVRPSSTAYFGDADLQRATSPPGFAGRGPTPTVPVVGLRPVRPVAARGR